MMNNGDAPLELSFLASDESGPLYKVVERKILQCLVDGEWKPGDRLPPENQLAKRFGVAVSTVRAGVRNLAASNVLTRRQGKGTFVTVHGRQPRFRFFNIHRNDGRTAQPSRRVIEFKSVVADLHVARNLDLRGGSEERVFSFTLILEDGGTPAGFYDIFLPERRFAGLTKTDIQTTTGNMYGLYQERFGVNVVRTEERVSAIKASARIVSLLDLPADEPVLQIDRIAYTFNDEPVEFRRTIHESRMHHYLQKQGLD